MIAMRALAVVSVTGFLLISARMDAKGREASLNSAGGLHHVTSIGIGGIPDDKPCGVRVAKSVRIRNTEIGPKGEVFAPAPRVIRRLAKEPGPIQQFHARHLDGAFFGICGHAVEDSLIHHVDRTAHLKVLNYVDVSGGRVPPVSQRNIDGDARLTVIESKRLDRPYGTREPNPRSLLGLHFVQLALHDALLGQRRPPRLNVRIMRFIGGNLRLSESVCGIVQRVHIVIVSDFGAVRASPNAISVSRASLSASKAAKPAANSVRMRAKRVPFSTQFGGSGLRSWSAGPSPPLRLGGNRSGCSSILGPLFLAWDSWSVPLPVESSDMRPRA